MARIEVKLVQPEYGFVATDEGGKSVTMDTTAESGGQGFGVRPMQNLLISLAGCSAMDIVSIFKKQRQDMTGLLIVVEGEREKNKVPALWEKAHMTFHVSGEVDVDKAKHAAMLSVEKYCSVAETLRRAGCEISWEMIVDRDE